jgi:hypothetical protein
MAPVGSGWRSGDSLQAPDFSARGVYLRLVVVRYPTDHQAHGFAVTCTSAGLVVTVFGVGVWPR